MNQNDDLSIFVSIPSQLLSVLIKTSTSDFIQDIATAEAAVRKRYVRNIRKLGNAVVCVLVATNTVRNPVIQFALCSFIANNSGLVVVSFFCILLE